MREDIAEACARPSENRCDIEYACIQMQALLLLRSRRLQSSNNLARNRFPTPLIHGFDAGDDQIVLSIRQQQTVAAVVDQQSQAAFTALRGRQSRD